MHQQISEIETMERAALLALWRETLGEAPPKHLSAPFLRRILAFEIQARRGGELSATLRKRIKADGTKSARETRPRLKPGARLIREWNGVSHVVDVADDGYLWRGERYRSLTAISKSITGTHWSGPRFFGLTGKAGQ
jgi:hypothetical protein